MRATWSGMIIFGLVNIPVKVYAATRDEKISFHQLHKDDGGRVKYEKVCKVCGAELDQEAITKGYEYRKGQYVLLSDEELDQVNLPTAKTISIQQFVPERQLNPLAYEKPYHLGPDENGAVAYAILREALKGSQKAAIAKVVLHSRERLAAIRTDSDALILETLHYNTELVGTDGIGIPGADVALGPRELELASILIEHMTTDFDPSQYHDEYETALRDHINKKIEGQEIVAPPAPEPATNVIDIMERLKASIGAAEHQSRNGERKTA